MIKLLRTKIIPVAFFTIAVSVGVSVSMIAEPILRVISIPLGMAAGVGWVIIICKLIPGNWWDWLVRDD